jgi:hypothetical protein
MGERRRRVVGVMTFVRRGLGWIEHHPRLKDYKPGSVEKTVDPRY